MSEQSFMRLSQKSKMGHGALCPLYLEKRLLIVQEVVVGSREIVCPWVANTVIVA